MKDFVLVQKLFVVLALAASTTCLLLNTSYLLDTQTPKNRVQAFHGTPGFLATNYFYPKRVAIYIVTLVCLIRHSFGLTDTLNISDSAITPTSILGRTRLNKRCQLRRPAELLMHGCKWSHDAGKACSSFMLRLSYSRSLSECGLN